jgi:SAM-dependent methyltransferase
MIEVEKTVAAMVRARCRANPARIALVIRRTSGLCRELMAAGHQVLVLSDRFFALRRTARLVAKEAGDVPVFVEVQLERLPIAPGTLDFVIVEHGLPRRPDVYGLVSELRILLNPGGWLIAPHPCSEGLRGAVERFSSLPLPGRRAPTRRHKLSGLLMRAGFSDIVQEPVIRHLRSWTVTAGRAGKFFDRAAEPVLFFFSNAHRTSQKMGIGRGP